MISILRGLSMGGDGLLSGDKAVQDWCHIFAFCFALASVDALVGLGFGRHLGVSAVCFVAACLFYLAGVKWPRIRQRVRSRKVAKPNAVAVASAPLIAGRAEWLQLAKDFEGCPKQVMAEWYRYGKPPTDRWQVGSWAQDDKCKSLCSLAGATLLSSPRVSAKLPQQVLSVSEPMYRWLYFLKERRGLNNYMAGVESLDDGSKAGVYAGHIANLAEVSAAACIECAAKET